MHKQKRDSNRTFKALDRLKFNKDLSQLIAIPSVSDNPAGVKQALHAMLTLGKTMGFEAHALLEDRVGVIEIGKGVETVGILVHVDVVPAGNDAHWHYPPFELTEAHDSYYGRGVADDKGPALAALYAMAQLLPYKNEMKKRVQMIVGTQEETAWHDMAAYCETQELPDYGFTPDGEFPITNMEKGYVDVELKFPRHFQGRTIDLMGGDSKNTIPDFAQIELSHFSKEMLSVLRDTETMTENENGTTTVRAIGKSVHSSSPQDGENAIVKLCHTLFGKLSLLPEIAALVIFVERELKDDLFGTSLGLNRGRQIYEGQDAHVTMISPTMLRTTEDSFILNINMRQTIGLTQSQITAAFDQKAACYGFTFEIVDYKPFLYVSPKRPFLQCMAEAYEKETGRENAFVLAHGTSYAKAMPNFVAWGPYFPEDEDTCHENDESIRIETLHAAYRVYAEALFQMAFDERLLIGGND
jgi:succinyl-diaminopimelate desuccinylase